MEDYKRANTIHLSIVYFAQYVYIKPRSSSDSYYPIVVLLLWENVDRYSNIVLGQSKLAHIEIVAVKNHSQVYRFSDVERKTNK